MPLTINGESVDDGLLDAEFSQIKAHFEQQANVSCCERDDEFMGYAKDNLIARVLLAQKAKESRKNQVKISVKEVQLKPKIDTNDYNIKLNQSRKFLRDGDKVKFTMRFRGREAEHPEFGQRILDKLKDCLLYTSDAADE